MRMAEMVEGLSGLPPMADAFRVADRENHVTARVRAVAK